MKQKTIKDDRISFRLDSDMKRAFEELCEQKGTTTPMFIRKFIKEQVGSKLVSKKEYIPKWKRERMTTGG